MFLLEYSAASDALASSLEAAIHSLERPHGGADADHPPSAEMATDRPTVAQSDELDADHDNLAFVGRQLEVMAAQFGQSEAVGVAASVRFQVEEQGGRSVTALLEKMFIKELDTE